MKRFILILATLGALLCFSACNKVEKNFVGTWSNTEGGVSAWLRVDKAGTCSATLSLDASKLSCSGTWLEIDNNTIKCYVSDTFGNSYTWQFTGHGDNYIYWMDYSVRLYKL